MSDQCKRCESFESGALPAGLPHIAYVLLWYPLFTQPFIFREVEELRKIMPVEVYTLYGRNLRHCSEEMKKAACHGHAYGAAALLPLCWTLIKSFILRPKVTWQLFKRSCWRKWETLETFGENLWAFCMGLVLAKQFCEDGIDFVYAPWPRGAATAAWVGATLACLPFAIAARGDNLEPADPDLADKLQAATFVRANNAADQKRIENFDSGQAKNKTILIYNSLTLPKITVIDESSRLTHPPCRLLALGRFDVTKGFDVLLKSCALLKRKKVNFKLVLAGGGGKVMGLGDLDQALRNLRKELHLDDVVSMPGLISHDNLPSILKESDIFVAPCVIHDSGRRDGIPNTVIEAMAYGLPVVSTDINALPEIVRNGETGLTVPPNDPEALAEAIIYLIKHPDLAHKMGKEGAALASDIFDAKANAQRLAKTFSYYYSLSQINKMEESKSCAA